MHYYKNHVLRIYKSNTKVKLTLNNYVKSYLNPNLKLDRLNNLNTVV